MKIFFCLFIILIISFNIANAKIEIFKPEYHPKETFQAELNFQNLTSDLTANNVQILKANNELSNIGILLVKINKEKYFIYGTIPETEYGNYKLVVKEVSKLIEEENFTISEQTNNIVSLNPAFIIFDPKNKDFFKIELQNKGNNIVNVLIKSENNLTKADSENLIINKASSAYFYFSVNKENLKEEVKANLHLMYKNNYTIPIYILNQVLPIQIIEKGNISFFTEKNGIKNYLTEYKINTKQGNFAEGTLFIENNLMDISNLSILINGNVSKIIKLSFDKIDLIEKGRTLSLSLLINDNAKNSLYEGNLILKNDNIQKILPIQINITANNIIKKENKSEAQIIQKKDNKSSNKTNANIVKSENKKTLSYKVMGFIIVIFIIAYFIVFRKSGKNKFRKFSDLVK